MLPFNLNEKSNIEVSFTFDSKGERYEGEGFLEWDPYEGFQLLARAKAKQKILKKNVLQAQDIMLIPQKNFRFQKIGDFGAGFAPHVNFSDSDEFFLRKKGTIKVSFPKLYFLNKKFSTKNFKCYGTCVFKIAKGAILSDIVHREVKLTETFPIEESESLEGLVIDDEFIEINGYINQDNQLKLYWRENKIRFSNKTKWNMAKALQDALSICLGQTVKLLKRELYQPRKIKEEIIKQEEVNVLSFFSPFGYKDFFDKELFLQLLKTFISDDKKQVLFSTIIKKLFYRIAMAINNNNAELITFVISSTLESFLRTYYGIVHKKISCKNKLNSFGKEYFNSEFYKDWIIEFDRIINCYEKYRNSVAHLSWTNNNNINFTDGSLNDLRFMARFYGYVILALLGYKDLAPNKF